jgi:hypothetical protein
MRNRHRFPGHVEACDLSWITHTDILHTKIPATFRPSGTHCHALASSANTSASINRNDLTSLRSPADFAGLPYPSAWDYSP